jgi:hypothetical protein
MMMMIIVIIIIISEFICNLYLYEMDSEIIIIIIIIIINVVMLISYYLPYRCRLKLKSSVLPDVWGLCLPEGSIFLLIDTRSPELFDLRFNSYK